MAALVIMPSLVHQCNEDVAGLDVLDILEAVKRGVRVEKLGLRVPSDPHLVNADLFQVSLQCEC